jgi:hypothetical protein
MTPTADLIELTLPWPPSVNHYWRVLRGRMIVSAAGRKYRARGWRTSTTVCSKVSGKKGNTLVIDPHDARKVESEADRHNVHEWYDQAFHNRVYDFKTSVLLRHAPGGALSDGRAQDPARLPLVGAGQQFTCGKASGSFGLVWCFSARPPRVQSRRRVPRR